MFNGEIYNFYFSKKQWNWELEEASLNNEKPYFLQVITSDLKIFQYTEMIAKSNDTVDNRSNWEAEMVYSSEDYAIISNGKPTSDLARCRLELLKNKNIINNF